jgi:hypothetical protein
VRPLHRAGVFFVKGAFVLVDHDAVLRSALLQLP